MAAAVTFAAAPAAEATFHEISIREVYPGSNALPDSGYVELQMYSGGQGLVKGHALTVYDSAGATIGSFAFGANVANAANQQTILVGDSGVQAAFGVTPDLTNEAFEIRRAGGAVCWAGTIDCVAWGAFGGTTPSSSGKPADGGGIPDGTALRRTIEPLCGTLLEAGDDSGDSAADFFDAAPQPRNNATAIAEKACTGPATTIDAKPANPTKSTVASFAYHSTAAATAFECKLDAAAFAGCSSGEIEYAGPLADGTHSFQVRARDAAENLGTATLYKWRIDTVAPTALIDTHPADPSAGGTATFTYHASETGAKFQCSLVAVAAVDAFSECAASGKTYKELADGEYRFAVQATDAAANQGLAASFEWTVDNSLGDTTPPDTAIDSAPPDPSSQSTASFSYHSTETGSTFECRLEGAAFSPCPASGIEYSGLENGSHSFFVRAIDASTNVDPTPAGYTFAVALPQPPIVQPPLAPAAFPAPPPAVVGPPAAPTRRKRHCKRRRHASAHAARRRCSRHHAGSKGRAR
ncbi:MAG TPA: hypothetical protein VHQ43_04895 [Solirubrobacterales bacterium]|nr:hypothetical protein [Solirubrobacterales bacterium]